MSNGKQSSSHSSPSMILLLGVIFSWIVLGMLYASHLTVGEEAVSNSGFAFAFYLVYAAFLSLSAFGSHVAAEAWVMGVGRFTLDFAAYMASGASFAVLAGAALTSFGVFPWVINIPMFFCVPVIAMLLHFTRRRQGGRESG